MFAVVHHNVKAAILDRVAFAHLRATARHLAEFPKRGCQGVFVLLAAVERPQRLAQQDVEKVLTAFSCSFRQTEHDLLTAVELSVGVGQGHLTKKRSVAGRPREGA